MLTVQIREAGHEIASFPGGKLGDAIETWFQQNDAEIETVGTLSLYVGLATVTVRQGEQRRKLDAIVMVG